MISRAEDAYKRLFPTESEKAAAFDKIAELFYNCNFGSTTKADIETLMFSIYIESILDKEGPANFNTYSDYTLSKALCITQSKVSNLKVRKELSYPYKDFEWKDSFVLLSKKATFEDGKVKLYIPDRNLFLEIKNAIEEAGGFVEIQLTPHLLQVNLPYFLDLILAIDGNDSRTEIIKIIKTKMRKDSKDLNILQQEPIGKSLLKHAPDLIIEIIGECIPVFGGTAKKIAHNLYNAIKSKENID